METKSQFIVTPEGAFFREDTTRYPIDPGPELAKTFMVGQSVKLKNFTTIPNWGNVSIAVQEDGVQHWTTAVEEIAFNTTYKTVGEGKEVEVIPLFVADPSNQEPSMTIVWNRASAMNGQKEPMHIKFMATVNPRPAHGNFAVSKQYLFAFDDKQNAWRMPLSNLYNTCELCNGEYSSVAPTAFDSFMKALEQFRKSSWNSDLFINGATIANFVRFSPLKSGFVTLPIKAKWQQWCTKVATTQSKQVIL